MVRKLFFLFCVVMCSCAHAIPGSPKGTCPHDFPIKGNVNSYIYHTPKSPYYYKTNAEVCFDSVDAAKRQGYIAPKR